MDSLPLSASATMPEPGWPLLVIVEGLHDIHFLKTLSTLLHDHDVALADLNQLEGQRSVTFLPIGGSNIKDMAPRVASLHKRMFVLLDREVKPHTTDRRQIVAQLNQRPGCIACLTRKRALENYLDPTVVAEVCGLELHFDDDSDVAGLLARQLLAVSGGPRWTELSCRGQKRLRERAKKLLNVHAVGRMTAERLTAMDQQGEIRGWLQTIQRLIESGVDGGPSSG